MPRKTERVAIEGVTYELTTLGGVEARELVVIFAKTLSGFVPLFTTGAGLDAQALSALSEALASLDPKHLEPLWDGFSRNAWVIGADGKTREKVADVFDDHFSGEYFAMMKFFFESARYNFAGFFGKALAESASASGSAAAK